VADERVIVGHISAFVTRQDASVSSKRVSSTPKCASVAQQCVFVTLERVLVTLRRVLLTTKRVLLTNECVLLTTKRVLLMTKRALLTNERVLLTTKRVLLTASCVVVATKRVLVTVQRVSAAPKSVFATFKHALLGLRLAWRAQSCAALCHRRGFFAPKRALVSLRCSLGMSQGALGGPRRVWLPVECVFFAFHCAPSADPSPESCVQARDRRRQTGLHAFQTCSWHRIAHRETTRERPVPVMSRRGWKGVRVPVPDGRASPKGAGDRTMTMRGSK
jgi:hypothetical protein